MPAHHHEEVSNHGLAIIIIMIIIIILIIIFIIIIIIIIKYVHVCGLVQFGMGWEVYLPLKQRGDIFKQDLQFVITWLHSM